MYLIISETDLLFLRAAVSYTEALPHLSGSTSTASGCLLHHWECCFGCIAVESYAGLVESARELIPPRATSTNLRGKHLSCISEVGELRRMFPIPSQSSPVGRSLSYPQKKFIHNSHFVGFFQFPVSLLLFLSVFSRIISWINCLNLNLHLGLLLDWGTQPRQYEAFLL